MAIDTSKLNKNAVVTVAHSLGWRGDYDRTDKADLCAWISKAHDSERDRVRNALYARTAWGWNDIDGAEGKDISEAKPDAEEGAAVDSKKAGDSNARMDDAENGSESSSDEEGSEQEQQDNEEREQQEGEGESKQDSKGKSEEERQQEQQQAAQDLAAAIRASEKDAIASGAVMGIANIPAKNDALAAAVAAFVATVASNAPAAAPAAELPSIDEIVERVRALIDGTPRTLTITRAGMPDIRVEGLTHRQFPELLQVLSAVESDGMRMNVWLVGPAGSGKTRAALEAAKALGLAFYSHGSLTAKHDAIGYTDANGNYVRTPFREAWEHGGVCLFDEFDGSIANAVVGFNQATSTPLYNFPDKVVPRHPDCVIIAACNTHGMGSTEYIGRMKQDKSSIDRFVWFNWEIDEKLETALAADTAWSQRVQKARRYCAEKGIKDILITPRATIKGCALLAAGMPRDRVDQMILRKGMSDEQWAGLSRHLGA